MVRVVLLFGIKESYVCKIMGHKVYTFDEKKKKKKKEITLGKSQLLLNSILYDII